MGRSDRAERLDRRDTFELQRREECRATPLLAYLVGINSLDLAFGIRSMVGLGAFGFNAGVFATVRFGGAIVLSPNQTFACRRGTIEAWIDTGLG